MSHERVLYLPLPPSQQAYSSNTSSPGVSSLGSASRSHAGSHSSFTSVASSHGPKTPSPSLPIGVPVAGSAGPLFASYDQQQYSNMNQPAADMYYPQHMSAGQAPPPQTVTSSGVMSHYSQPPPLQPTHLGQYPPPAQYTQPYGYSNGLTSPQSAPPGVSNPMGSQNVLPLPQGAGQPPPYSGFDTSGQVAPPGMKPRVTATLWEDEGSLCFQVEARGICVARREDNHMINGTKLLNVAGMTRGRRDGILKSEKVRHVVKIGPMHLKGVWIPFERALDFANKEKITELLYPLFVHNIGALLYHPTNQNRTNQVMASAERRKQEQNQMRSSQPGPGLAPIQQHHHSMGMGGPQQPLPSHSNMGRPGLDRAHTFPTPPTSASSVMGGSMGTSDGFQWAQQSQGMSGSQGTNPMSVDTGLSNARSMPATPASTPPGTTVQSMHQYQPGSHSYDASRPMYNAPSAHHSPYQQGNSGSQDRSIYGQPDTYGKNDMGPPSSRPAAPGAVTEHKPSNGIMQSSEHGGQGVSHPNGEEEAEHEHDAEYTHDSNAYDASRGSYNYGAPPVGHLSAEHQHISPEMPGTANHAPTSGRATPRTTTAPQPYYSHQSGYNTPPRAPQQSSSNLYNVMSNDRGASMGGHGDVYAPPADMSSMSNGYPSQQPIMNGTSGGLKRGRDEEDDLQRPLDGDPSLDLKRRKTLMDSTAPPVGYDTIPRPSSTTVGAARRR